MPAQRDGRRPVFVLHEHQEAAAPLRPPPRGGRGAALVGRPARAADDLAKDRLAVPVDDHDLEHATYEDETKSIADTGWWELEDRTERRTVFVLHGRGGPRRYALVSTDQGALLHLVKDQPALSRSRTSRCRRPRGRSRPTGPPQPAVNARPLGFRRE